MKKQRYIIAGGGCAGLSLAYQLVNSAVLSDFEILIIDRDQKIVNDRTWCFWSSANSVFESVVSKRWQSVSFKSEAGERTRKLSKYSYQIIQSKDFYRYIWEALSAAPNVQFIQGEINDISEDQEGPYVKVDTKIYRADWVFNSCFKIDQFKSDNPNSHFLLQHFKGWRISTPEASFDEQEMTLMDFRTAQKGHARFFYVLPFSNKEALVEYTIFSPTLLNKTEYDRALESYIRDKLNIEDYSIEEEEFGVIPMSDSALPANPHHRIIPIGTLAGAVKPTTGYAFLRIQKQVAQIRKQLEQNGHPLAPIQIKKRFRFYDVLLLHILQNNGKIAHEIFTKLFFNNKIERILTFLDERSNLLQEARIFAFLPIKPFLKALWVTIFFNKNLKALLPSRFLSIKRT